MPETGAERKNTALSSYWIFGSPITISEFSMEVFIFSREKRSGLNSVPVESKLYALIDWDALS
jgi:hypothetical protein